MKKNITNILASVIIVNFNNERFLQECLRSLFCQTYKKVEIIVVDDQSTDNSLNILKKYKKKIKIAKAFKGIKSKYGSYNQINSYLRGYKESRGEYIFFLDSDDFFTKKKIEIVIKEFQKDKSLNVIFDLPILKYNKFFIKKSFNQKKFLISSWPRFTNQSCITIKRSFITEIFKSLKIKKFNDIWFDFRIACYCFLKEKKIKVLYKYLTFYRQVNNSASAKFPRFSKNWWSRRNQAHDFMSYLCKKLYLRDKFTLDKLITKIIAIFI